jgi:hypothetical protein
MQTANGFGLDGVTKVKCLLIGESPEYPGMTFMQDIHGNNSVTKKAAPDYVVTAVKL